MTENKYDSGVYRIHDRFYISKRGPVYMLDRVLVSTLKLNDIMYDSKHHCFKVSGIEHFIGQFLIDNDDRPIGVLFEMIDGKAAQGGVMIKDIDTVETPADTTILGGDPLPWLSAEQMWKEVEKIQSIQELVDEYAAVHNKFWYI